MWLRVSAKRLGAWPLLAVMLLFLFLAALILAQHTIHVLLVEQQLAHLIERTPVGGIRRLFLRQQLGVFLLQALDGGQLFDAQLVKGVLRRLVQKDVALMLREILFRVTGLAVARVNVAGLGVVDDLLRRCESCSGNYWTCYGGYAGEHLCAYPAVFPCRAG